MEKSLAQLTANAKNAARGWSFSPEKVGERMIKDYETLLAEDLEQINEAPGSTKATYKERFIKHLGNYMNAQSRIMSPMISGPSNFPVRQQEKYHRWEKSANNKFENFRQKAIAGIKRQIKKSKPIEQVNDEAWQKIESKILHSAKVIVGIDNGTEPYSRQLFVSGITGLITRTAQNGQTDLVNKALNLIRELNKQHKKPIITERNAIFKLVTVAETKESKQQKRANSDSLVYGFEGGNVTINFQDERIQLRYDVERVTADLYKKLTRELHFRHSKTNKAFQLYINNQSIYKVNQFLDMKIPYLS